MIERPGSNGISVSDDQFTKQLVAKHGKGVLRRIKNAIRKVWGPDIAASLKCVHDPEDGQKLTLTVTHPYEVTAKQAVDRESAFYGLFMKPKDRKILDGIILGAPDFGTTRSLAKALEFDLVGDPFMSPVFRGRFEYEDGGGQTFGLRMERDVIQSFLGVFGVWKLSEVNGRSCWVTHSQYDVAKLEPLHAKDGKPFDVANAQP